MLAILLLAAGVRVAFVLVVAQHDHKFYDSYWYRGEARTIAQGRGFVDPAQFEKGHPHKSIANSDHPPLAAIVLAGVWYVMGPNNVWLRFTTALAGVVTVGLLGLLGRDVAGERAGLLAALIAALYPFLWLNDGTLMSEAFATLLLTGALLVFVRLVRRPSWPKALGLGLLCGLLGLTRAELVLLAPILAIPLLVVLRRESWATRVALIALVAAGVGVLIGPWVAYNQSRFKAPVYVSTGDGLALLGTNCDQVWHGPDIGLWSTACLQGVSGYGDPSQISRSYRKAAFRYIRGHEHGFPAVAMARVGRGWGFWDPAGTFRYNTSEGRVLWASWLGFGFEVPVILLGVAGVVELRRRHRLLWPILAPIALVSVLCALFYGIPRFVAPAQPEVILLGACGALALGARYRKRNGDASSDTGGKAASRGDTIGPAPVGAVQGMSAES